MSAAEHRTAQEHCHAEVHGLSEERGPAEGHRPATAPAPGPVLEHSEPVTIPTDHGSFSVIGWRVPEGHGAPATEHVSLTAPPPPGEETLPPLVRLHSECLTGDVLGSWRCDCGPQLHLALERIHAHGGTVLYLRNHEGRGIGLVNKLRAYALQDQGFDTVDANTRLGFAIDARDFGVAARMLSLLGQNRVRLLTNNPAKIAYLRGSGIVVDERLSVEGEVTPQNEGYLRTKVNRSGHLMNVDALPRKDSDAAG